MHFVTVLFIIPALVTAHELCYRGNAKPYSHTYNKGEELEVHHQKALEEIRQAFANTKGVNQTDDPFARIPVEYIGDPFILELKELEATLSGQNSVTVKELIPDSAKASSANMSSNDVIMDVVLPAGKAAPGRNRHRGKVAKQRRTDQFRMKKNVATLQSIDEGIRQRLKLD
ncbi:unnamed protein product [Heligmosomoides polygyrus]|uniref:Secreted protein n=1 Tax=Heligmosomoides polygyrus TaxID=6339 RepID=A0A183G954_HELPZ|nr:unnamed protein product [Heligmosomoides polygyrus]